ncbi:MAG: hypothetical protein AB1627_06325 [Chloroflexota bacterium]
MRVLAGTVLVLALVLAACGATATDGGGDATDEPAAPTDAAPPTADAGGGASPDGSTGGGSGSGFGTHPCDLLDQSAVEAATGGSGMAPTAVSVDATSGLCGYKSPSLADEVVLSVWEGDMATSMWMTMDMLVGQGAEGIERADGLGADAVYSASGPANGELILNRNGTTVQVAVRLGERSPEEIKAIALELGRQIAGRL